MLNHAPSLALPENAGAPQRYGTTAIALHWLTAVLIVVRIHARPVDGGPAAVATEAAVVRVAQVDRHHRVPADLRSPGVAVGSSAAAAIADAGVADARRAHLARRCLYALLIVIPISGWIYSSSTGIQVVYLGLLPLPDLVAKDRDLAHVLRLVHVTLNFTLLTVVCVHVAAALKHHFHRPRHGADPDAAAQRRKN